MEDANEPREKDMFSRIGDDREELHQWLIMDTWPKDAAMFLIAGVIPTQIYEGFGFFKVTGGLLHNHDGEKDERIHQIAISPGSGTRTQTTPIAPNRSTSSTGPKPKASRFRGLRARKRPATSKCRRRRIAKLTA
jgi:hypothetical protein